jgi:hypothetical protein
MHGVRFLLWFFRLLQFFGRRVYRHEYTVTFELFLVYDGEEYEYLSIRNMVHLLSVHTSITYICVCIYIY